MKQAREELKKLLPEQEKGKAELFTLNTKRELIMEEITKYLNIEPTKPTNSQRTDYTEDSKLAAQNHQVYCLLLAHALDSVSVHKLLPTTATFFKSVGDIDKCAKGPGIKSLLRAAHTDVKKVFEVRYKEQGGAQALEEVIAIFRDIRDTPRSIKVFREAIKTAKEHLLHGGLAAKICKRFGQWHLCWVYVNKFINTDAMEVEYLEIPQDSWVALYNWLGRAIKQAGPGEENFKFYPKFEKDPANAKILAAIQGGESLAQTNSTSQHSKSNNNNNSSPKGSKAFKSASSPRTKFTPQQPAILAKCTKLGEKEHLIICQPQEGIPEGFEFYKNSNKYCSHCLKSKQPGNIPETHFTNQCNRFNADGTPNPDYKSKKDYRN